MTDPKFTPEEREICINVLQRISEDPSVIADDERIKALIAKIHRVGKKADRRSGAKRAAEQDRALRSQTAMVQRDLQNRAVAEPAHSVPLDVLKRPARCYVCKRSFSEIDGFYHLLCPQCAQTNREKREQRADLTGRTAVLTGGRIKIGFHTALRLLRDGARVIVTTRFPDDAQRRFSQETDHARWCNRLHIVALDLRNLKAVEEFVQHLLDTEPSVEILINNAAQTIKRPLAFYEPLLARESGAPVLLEALSNYPSQSPPLSANREIDGLNTELEEAIAPASFFPVGAFDPDGQQVDLRPSNSWSLRLHEVSTLELLEVHLVNALAPFLLCRGLKPLFLRSKFTRRFIVNVSAMEGQFARASKTDRHPHTNTAKAALNMLTRTSAADYARHRIYMNSVDTGWVTDEHPYDLRMRRQEQYGFHTPLDHVDGASRVIDPIICGLSETSPSYGLFLKDYAPYPW